MEFPVTTKSDTYSLSLLIYNCVTLKHVKSSAPCIVGFTVESPYFFKLVQLSTKLKGTTRPSVLDLY